MSIAATSTDASNWLSEVESPLPLTPSLTLENPFPGQSWCRRCSTIAEEHEHTLHNGDLKKTYRILMPSGGHSDAMFSIADDAFEEEQTGDVNSVNLDAYSAGHMTSGLACDLVGDSITRLTEYEVHYEELLKRSIKLWKEIQTEKEETGLVDKKKIATLKLFL